MLFVNIQLPELPGDRPEVFLHVLVRLTSATLNFHFLNVQKWEVMMCTTGQVSGRFILWFSLQNSNVVVH